MSDDDGCGMWLLGIAMGAAGIYAYNEYWAEPEVVPIAAPAPSGFTRPVSDIPITSLDSKTAWILDVSSVSGKRNNRQGWIRADHSQDTSTSSRKTMTLWKVDCETNKYQKLESVAYAPNGDPSTIPVESEASYAVPDSNAEAVIESLCLPNFEIPVQK